jgi:uncharacterized membrane protein
MKITRFHHVLHKIGVYLAKPRVRLLVGFLLLFAGICEISETVIEEFIGVEVRMAHGMIVFALSQVFVAITHILEGIEDFTMVAEIEGVHQKNNS